MITDYLQEAVTHGATHVGEKQHGWRRCPISHHWQVYKCGAGWANATPATNLVPIVIDEQVPRHYLDMVKAWEKVKRLLYVHENSGTLGSLDDLSRAIEAFDVLMEQR